MPVYLRFSSLLLRNLLDSNIIFIILGEFHSFELLQELVAKEEVHIEKIGDSCK